MSRLTISFVITIFTSIFLLPRVAIATPGDNPRLDRGMLESFNQDFTNGSVAKERYSSKVEFLTGTAELSDENYAMLTDFFAELSANDTHKKVTIAIWPDMMGGNTTDENQQDLINSRISEITAVLVDQGYAGDFEVRNMATTIVDPNVDPELSVFSPSTAIILIESSAQPFTISH